VEKTTRTRGRHLACPEKGCPYTREMEDDDREADRQGDNPKRNLP
jgi:hypothetical protein